MEDWIVRVNEELGKLLAVPEEVEKWRKQSIYMLPAHVTDLDKKAYKPQVVSLGPYHHNLQHLEPMEEHKHRAFLHFMMRSGVALERYANALGEVVQDLKDQYDQLEPMWLEDTSSFLKLMIVDGCFILEILRRPTTFVDYAPNDPIFSNHGMLYILPFLRWDMLLLENQVPLLVLTKLVEVEKGAPQPDDYLNKLVLKFFHSGGHAWQVGRCLHILDIYRKSLLTAPRIRQRRLRQRGYWHDTAEITRFPSASELLDTGIRLNRSKTRSLRDISFHQNTLRLPEIIVDTTTKSILLNLIAFERFHVGAGNEVSSYMFFLTSLIKGSQDVSLLRSCGIIINNLSNDEDVAEMFNLLGRDVIIDPESSLDTVYRVVSQRLRNRFRKRLHQWRAELVRTYFRSPWVAISVVAAILLFTLTIIQTIYSVLSYIHKN
ncbi:UPF0481 protein At3g47200-like [Sesamum indicum]|uniref:UPF0481 protein At3g47200-like n=1 Tax=Sesamum indicum TaxID=4182 RepID=A0A6I9TLL1_SESIN|nr:UPF0481 protein At3g47200-like [Sesamum indicum]